MRALERVRRGVLQDCAVSILDAFPISLMRTDLRADQYHVCDGSTVLAEINAWLLALLLRT